MRIVKLTHCGSSTRIHNESGMRVDCSLYPYHFENHEKRTENAAIRLLVATDEECSHGHAILLPKPEAAYLFGLLGKLLSQMADEPQNELDHQSPKAAQGSMA
jgi:hypothetical protein